MLPVISASPSEVDTDATGATTGGPGRPRSTETITGCLDWAQRLEEAPPSAAPSRAARDQSHELLDLCDRPERNRSLENYPGDQTIKRSVIFDSFLAFECPVF